MSQAKKEEDPSLSGTEHGLLGGLKRPGFEGTGHSGAACQPLFSPCPPAGMSYSQVASGLCTPPLKDQGCKPASCPRGSLSSWLVRASQISSPAAPHPVVKLAGLLRVQTR